MLEKVIADHLSYILEDGNLLNDNQAGFRQNGYTTDRILKLVQQAMNTIHKKEGETITMVTYFDYAKAYNKIWRDGLLHKMQNMNITWRFIKYVRHFLSGRKTYV